MISMFAEDRFSEQIQVNVRQHALESAYFVVNATVWLNPDQQAQTRTATSAISRGYFTAIASLEGELLGEALPPVIER